MSELILRELNDKEIRHMNEACEKALNARLLVINEKNGFKKEFIEKFKEEFRKGFEEGFKIGIAEEINKTIERLRKIGMSEEQIKNFYNL